MADEKQIQINSLTITKNAEEKEMLDVTLKAKQDLSMADIEKLFGENKEIISLKIKG